MSLNVIGISAAAVVIATSLFSGCRSNAAEKYAPVITPQDFSSKITNPYFNLPVGKKMTFEGKSKDGVERVVIEIPGETRTIMGVETLVYRDRVYIGKTLVEDTKDFLAQDRDGNVWYFGEEVDNYEKGKVKDHDGSWIAGEDGAQPGIWMKASPKVGDNYRQEYYKGEAEDMAKVVAVGEAVKVTAGSFKDCVRTYDWTPLDKKSKEHKTYCSEAGGEVLSEHIGTDQRVELIKVEIGGLVQPTSATGD